MTGYEYPKSSILFARSVRREHWTSDISARDALKPQVLLPRIKIPVRTRSNFA